MKKVSFVLGTIVIASVAFYLGCGSSTLTSDRHQQLFSIEGNPTQYTYDELLELERQGQITDSTVIGVVGSNRNFQIYADSDPPPPPPPPPPDPPPPPPPSGPPNDPGGNADISNPKLPETKLSWGELKRRYR